MAANNKGTPSVFLSQFLNQPVSNIPKGAQWAVMFHDLNSIAEAIKQAYALEPNTKNWNTQEAAARIITESYQTAYGCLFCQAIGLPGEGINIIPGNNIKHNSLIGSYVGTGRTDFQQMRMTFLETNVSFVDSFLRGWTLATAAFGLIARSGDKNYRTNMSCYRFGITPEGPTILQEMYFEGLCCINVAQEEYNYNPVTAPVEREAQFLYHSYSVNTVSENSLLQ